MATTIVTKNNDTAGVAPSAGQLVKGELAVNVTDKRLYTLDASNNVVLISSGSDYIVPVTVDVNSASTAVTIDQAGAGGGIDLTNSGNGEGIVLTSSGSGNAMRITNTGTGNSLLVEDSANPDSTPVVIKSTGELIVGYTDSVATGSFEVVGDDDSTTRAHTIRFSANASGPALVLSKSRSGTIGTQTIAQSGDSVGAVGFRASDGTQFITGAQIEAIVDGVPGLNDMPTSLIFGTTADGAASPTERLRISPTGAWALAGSANYGTQGQLLTSNGNAAPTWSDQFLSITFLISGGGSVIQTGIQGDLTVPFSCTITEWTLLADQTGSIVVDIWKDTYANFPPTVADTITGSAKPTISASNKGQSSTLTGWTATISAGDTLRFNVDSALSITRVTLSLKVKRT
jgi:hypothetical protein